jgi:hypothetical protein
VKRSAETKLPARHLFGHGDLSRLCCLYAYNSSWARRRQRSGPHFLKVMRYSGYCWLSL